MKILLFLAFLILLADISVAQSRVITKADYDGNRNGAVYVTNEAFPFVFTVVTDTYENGKLISTRTDIAERQAQGVERETATLVKGGKTLRSYSIQVGFGNHTYCSKDGVSWTGPQETVCPDPENSGFLVLTLPRRPEKTEYTVSEKMLKGEVVKVYREYAEFAASAPSKKRQFSETILTIDSRGFFIDVVTTEGTLEPRTITMTRKQSWKVNAKFPPVVAPKK